MLSGPWIHYLVYMLLAGILDVLDKGGSNLVKTPSDMLIFAGALPYYGCFLGGLPVLLNN